MTSVEKLEGWISVSEAAKILQISPQGVHHMIVTGKLKAKAIGEKPLFILWQDEVLELALARMDWAEERARLQEKIDRQKAKRAAAGRPMLDYLDRSEEI